MTNANTPNAAPAASPAPTPITPPAAIRPVAERDLELVGRLARDLTDLHRAIKKGDRAAIVEARGRLVRAPDDMKRVLVIARRAYARE